MLKRLISHLATPLTVILLLSSCGSPATATSTGTEQQNVSAVNGGEGEGEGEGGVEAALVTYADAEQGFAIGYPSPWTKDSSVSVGSRFIGGDDSMMLEFVTPPAGTDATSYAQADQDTLKQAFPDFKQVGLAPSTEVKNAVVQGFEATGTSSVTGKTFPGRGDRYYMSLADGRIAVLTVFGPSNHYDREGVRDIALTFKTTK
jgi:hypothetical protein